MRIADGYGILGELLGRAAEVAKYAGDTMTTVRGRCLAAQTDRRPRVHCACGPGLAGSINAENLEFPGLRNVAAEVPGGLATVSPEQVLRRNPEVVIIAIDMVFAGTVRENALWRSVRAVREGRVHLSPKLPFGWVDFPPGVKRLIGLWWLGPTVYLDRFAEDLRVLTRDFYQRFYQAALTDPQVSRVLAARG